MNKSKIKVLKWIFVNLKKCNLHFNLLISYISFCVLPQIQIYLSQLHEIFLEIAAIPNPTSTKPSPQISMMPLITQLSNCHELWPIYTDPPKPSILRNHNFIHQFFFLVEFYSFVRYVMRLKLPAMMRYFVSYE